MALKFYIPKNKPMLYLRLTVADPDSKGKKLVDTRLKIDDLNKSLPPHWNESAQIFSPRKVSIADTSLREQISEYNNIIQTLSEKIPPAIKTALSEGRNASYIKEMVANIRSHKGGENNNQKITTLKQLIDDHIENKADVENKATYKSNAKAIPDDIMIQDVDYRFLSKFVKEKLIKKDGYAYRSAKEIVKLIKASLTYGIDISLPQVNQKALTYKVKTSDFNIIANPKEHIITFNDAEVEELKKTSVELKPNQENARKIMVFGMAIGQRAEDTLRIIENPKEYITMEADGTATVRLTQKKTKIKVVVPITMDEALLPFNIRPINYQAYKYQIKSVCKKLKFNRIVKKSMKSGAILKPMEIHKAIGTHTIRRTSATRWYKHPDMNIQMAMKLTGHKNFENFLKYIGEDAGETLVERYREKVVAKK